MLQDDTVADHVRADVDPTAAANPPRGSWPRLPVANLSSSTVDGASSPATLTSGGTLDSRLGWRRCSRLAWLVHSSGPVTICPVDGASRLLAVTLLAVQVLVGLLGYLQIGIVSHFGWAGHLCGCSLSGNYRFCAVKVVISRQRMSATTGCRPSPYTEFGFSAGQRPRYQAVEASWPTQT